MNELVSLCIFTYNQEDFIKETIESAFSQTYENLEIIISDDCSQDNTYNIIRECITNYTGKHKITLLQNDHNLGLVPHINKILFKYAKGKYIDLAAGDDVLMPQKISSAIKIFQQYNVSGIAFPYIKINQNSQIIGKEEVTSKVRLFKLGGDYIKSTSFMTPGAGLIIDREILSFGELNNNCATEDSTLRFRCMLLNGIYYAEDDGLYYRIHENNISSPQSIFKLKTMNIAAQYDVDLKYALDNQLVCNDTYISLKRKIIRYATLREYLERNTSTHNTIVKKVYYLSQKYIKQYFSYLQLALTPKIFTYSFFRILYIIKFLILELFTKSLVLKGFYPLNKNYKIGHYNLGDDLNLYLIKLISKRHIIPYNYSIISRILKNKTIYSCIGSILSSADSRTIIWGSGAIENKLPTNFKCKAVYSIRGPLSYKLLRNQNITVPQIYGDPVILISQFYKPIIKKKYKIGIIPHYIDEQNPLFKEYLNISNIKIISMHNYSSWKETINTINECEFILSSSLHGLIIADSYGIPNIWCKFSEKVYGKDFKFYDYFGSVNRDNEQAFIFTRYYSLESLIDLKKKYKQPTIDFTKIINSCPFIRK